MEGSTSVKIYPHDIFLERTVLRLIPRGVTPNQITMVRIVATPIVFFLILHEKYGWGIPLFVLAAFTDAMDGSLARTRNQITDWGKLFDPIADKLLIGSLVILLLFRHLNPLVGFIVLGLEIVMILGGLLRKRKGKDIQANVWGKIKMILQFFAVFCVLVALLIDYPFLLQLATWFFGGAIIFALMSILKQGI